MNGCKVAVKLDDWDLLIKVGVTINFFQITGGNNLKLKVTFSGSNSQQVNELGVFIVN